MNKENLPERSYHVIWEIDVYAKTPEEAAEKALEIQRDKLSEAKVFNVQDNEINSYNYDIDLEAPKEDYSLIIYKCNICGNVFAPNAYISQLKGHLGSHNPNAYDFSNNEVLKNFKMEEVIV